MQLFTTFSIIITLIAAFGYINFRYLKLPASIGVMLIALFFSGVLTLLDFFQLTLVNEIQDLIRQIDFDELLLDFMLSFLLFAGSLHVNFKKLSAQLGAVLSFATIGVVLSTLIIGTISYYLFHLLGIPIPYIHCLIFGTLISPTDPIAVLSILKTANVPEQLEVKITGESLFNDGVAVVLFISLVEINNLGIEHVTAGHIALLFVKEALGGALLGAVAGYIAFRLLRSIDSYKVEVMITLALVMGTYSLASFLHISGPLSMVIAGLIVGNQGRSLAMSDITLQYLDKFWELVDEVLNSVLFGLIGLEVTILVFKIEYLYAGLLSTIVVLFARFVSVGGLISLLRLRRSFIIHTLKIMIWGGMRGGISIALALSLSSDMSRELIVSVTYIVVIFSILTQGLTIGKLVRRLSFEQV